MTVLLIGGSGRFMDSLIDKMNKCGHQVYLLTGQKDKRSSYQHVFERYNFEYDTDSIEDIFKSIQPELILFMGAYDTNFDWSMPRQESVRYTAALTNLLSAYSITGKGRFVYISSHEVYSSVQGANIRENADAEPKGLKAMAIAHGEELCENYRKRQGMDTLILRFDHAYWEPQKRERGCCTRDNKIS